MLYFSLAALINVAIACTNIIVTKEAMMDQSNVIAYNADSGTLYGSLYHYPANKHLPGELHSIYDWDSGVYLGDIPEEPITYNVVGNINEFGLVIGESTFGGLGPLQKQVGAMIDYGSLIWVTLQRTKTARDAIKLIDNLLSTYGYFSEGESFSIADTEEAWIMEIIGKGDFERGAVWVAIRLPPGSITAHANQARIQHFPLNDTNNCLYSNDVISFARKVGLYTGRDEDFSFSDIYDPVTFEGARFCDARVWSLLGSVMGKKWMMQYQDYAEGRNLTNRMPLFVMPPHPLSLSDITQMMRSHYEDTSLDMQGIQFEDVGAVNANVPYRAHPLTWQSGAKEYFNERPVATQQTGWNFVAQSRGHMPGPLSALLWFGVDDASTTVRLPIYGSSTRIPHTFAGQGSQDGVRAPMMTFDFHSAFYAFNVVANFAYSRWNLVYPDILERLLHIEKELQSKVLSVEDHAIRLLDREGEDAAVAFVTDFSDKLGERLVHEWNEFFGELFVRYRDGYRITADTTQLSCGCRVESASYPQKWYDDIAASTGDHYVMPAGEREGEVDLHHQHHHPVGKLSSRGVQDWEPVRKNVLLERR
eukprot:gene2444-4738_t